MNDLIEDSEVPEDVPRITEDVLVPEPVVD